jgi:hypothetical protein
MTQPAAPTAIAVSIGTAPGYSTAFTGLLPALPSPDQNIRRVSCQAGKVVSIDITFPGDSYYYDGDLVYDVNSTSIFNLSPPYSGAFKYGELLFENGSRTSKRIQIVGKVSDIVPVGSIFSLTLPLTVVSYAQRSQSYEATQNRFGFSKADRLDPFPPVTPRRWQPFIEFQVVAGIGGHTPSWTTGFESISAKSNSVTADKEFLVTPPQLDNPYQQVTLAVKSGPASVAYDAVSGKWKVRLLPGGYGSVVLAARAAPIISPGELPVRSFPFDYTIGPFYTPGDPYVYPYPWTPAYDLAAPLELTTTFEVTSSNGIFSGASLSSVYLGWDKPRQLCIGDQVVWASAPDDTGMTNDVQQYLNKIEAADGIPLETAVRQAVANFVAGCKADGIWTSLNSCCLLAGPRTLAGALIPLQGDAPSNFNFTPADYNRKTGLKGDGASKYLNSNHANNLEAKMDQHLSVYVTQAETFLFRYYIGLMRAFTSSTIYRNSTGSICARVRNSQDTEISTGITNSPTGFLGAQRNGSTGITIRAVATENFYTIGPGGEPTVDPILVFTRGTTGGAPMASYTNSRISFYSIGSSLSSLALLENRISTYMAAINSAIV